MLRISALITLFLSTAVLADSPRRVILLTGYWAPTNEMLREFSANADQNPSGWKGEDWEGSGYDVRAFFPEFPPGSGSVGKGDFQVDFTATKSDHAKYTQLYHPVVLIGFGHGPGPWVVEQNFPDWWNGTGYLGHSTLPADSILRAVNSDLGEWFASANRAGNPGNFLCGYMAMLNAQYAEKHADANDPAHVAAAGFIHVNTDLNSAVRAVHDTLRTVIKGMNAP